MVGILKDCDIGSKGIKDFAEALKVQTPVSMCNVRELDLRGNYVDQTGAAQIQSALAKKVGVSRQTIYYLERGDSIPKLDLSLRIAEVLKEPIENIFYFKPIINDLIGSLPGNEIIEMSGKKEMVGFGKTGIMQRLLNVMNTWLNA